MDDWYEKEKLHFAANEGDLDEVNVFDNVMSFSYFIVITSIR